MAGQTIWHILKYLNTIICNWNTKQVYMQCTKVPEMQLDLKGLYQQCFTIRVYGNIEALLCEMRYRMYRMYIDFDQTELKGNFHWITQFKVVNFPDMIELLRQKIKKIRPKFGPRKRQHCQLIIIKSWKFLSLPHIIP